MAKRRNPIDQFVAKVAFEALRGDKILQEVASKQQLHPQSSQTLKRHCMGGTDDVSSVGGKFTGQSEAEVSANGDRCRHACD